MPATDTELRIDYKPTGKDGQVTLTACVGTEILAIDRLDIAKASARDRFAKQVADGRDGIDKNALRDELLKIATSLTGATIDKDPAKSDPLDAMPERIKAAALDMLRSPELIRIVVDDIARLGVTGEKTLSATVYLIGTSRLLEKPLAGIVQGPTSSGKSYVIRVVSRMFPPEAVIQAHKMTPESLVHLPHGELVHRFVVAGERNRCQDDKAAEATRALREMLSDGRLSKMIPLKRSDGAFETAVINQPGPIAYVESTTLQSILDEDRNRCIVLSTDERPEQTRRIIEAMARQKEAAASNARAEEIVLKHHAAQRMLKAYQVTIPFAGILADRYPNERTDARRSFGHLLSMVEVVTLIHQYRRTDEPSDGAVIEATVEDYAIARYLLAGPIARTQSGALSEATRRFYDRLSSWAQGTDFTTGDVTQHETVIGDIQTIRAYVKLLAQNGYLEVVEPNRGNKPARYKLASKPPDDATAAGLPTVEEIAQAMRMTDTKAPPCRVES